MELLCLVTLLSCVWYMVKDDWLSVACVGCLDQSWLSAQSGKQIGNRH